MKRIKLTFKQTETQRLEMLTAIAEAEERGEIIGEIRGEIKGRDEIIRKMLLDGRNNLEEISEITGVALKDLELRYEALFWGNAPS